MTEPAPGIAPLPAPSLSPRAGATEALRAAVALVVLLGVGKSLASVLPGGNDFVFTAAAAFQLYVPLWLIQRANEAPESHGIHVHGLLLGPIAKLRAWVVARRRARRARGRPGVASRVLAHYGRGATFRARDLVKDVGLAVLVALITFPPFAVAQHLWLDVGRPAVFGAAPIGDYVFKLPPDLLETLVKNTLLVGLPEEMFYRGFVETRLERLWPTRWTVLGIPIGRTVILASAFFALGHFVGEWNPARLGPFFPAFVFSALTRKSGSITGAVLYHGLSNAFSAAVFYGYR